jgi:teichoic acid transport system permease protein
MLTMPIALLTSALEAITRDNQTVTQVGMRVVFFISSILYLPTNHLCFKCYKIKSYYIFEG